MLGQIQAEGICLDRSALMELLPSRASRRCKRRFEGETGSMSKVSHPCSLYESSRTVLQGFHSIYGFTRGLLVEVSRAAELMIRLPANGS